MTLLPRSAASRIAILSAIAVITSISLLGGGVLVAVKNAFRQQLDDSIELTTASLVGEFDEDGFDHMVEDIEVREASPSGGLGFAVFGPDGRKKAGELRTKMPQEEGWHLICFIGPKDNKGMARALATDLADGSRLLVAADTKPVEDTINTIVRIFVLGLAGVILLGVVLAILLNRYLKRRFEGIVGGSTAFAEGDLSARAVVGPRNDEFDQLAASLNAMLDRIEGLLINLRQVTSDLAHDLRTPLAKLRSQLESLRAADAADHADLVESAIEKNDEILSMFAAILRIAELDSGELGHHFEPLDLVELVKEIHEAHEVLAEGNGDSLSVECGAGPIVVKGDRELLAQALINLLQNAFVHTPQGTGIIIGAEMRAGAPVLFIRDNGPGIRERDRARATDRFVRLDASRSTPGHGLGLSLVEAVAKAHGGELVLRDASPGLDAVICLRGDRP